MEPVTSGGDGSLSQFMSTSYQAPGGLASTSADGGSGGSGGGAGTGGSNCSAHDAGDGGSDGSDGQDGFNAVGGTGQGFSTREFNQQFNSSTNTWETIDSSSTATLYGSGGGGHPCNSDPIDSYIGQGGIGAGSGFNGTRNAAANRGGGGGGIDEGTGGDGGSGIVMVRYPTGELNASGGSVTQEGDYTIHTFTADGTFQVN